MRVKNHFVLIFFISLMIPVFFLYGGLSQELSQSQEKKEKEPLSKWSKQWLEEVVPYIITDVEKTFFINLPTEEERGKFMENFWKKRDPDPKTPENEFKLEYYRRIALANKFFGASGIRGWRTDRGKIFILLGPPNEIQRDMSPSQMGFSAFHGTKEVWNYWGLSNPRLPYNMEFAFVDKLGMGNYVLERSVRLGEMGSDPFDIGSMHVYFDYMEYMSEAMRNPFENLDKLRGIVTTQVTYDRIPIKYDLFYLKGSAERTHIPLAIEIPYSALTQKEIEGEYHFSLTVLIDVSNKLGQIIFEWSKDIKFKHTSADFESLKDETLRVQTSLSLEAEAYRIHLLALDNFSGKIGTLHQEFSVPGFSIEGLSMSDIILSSERIAVKQQVGSAEMKMLTEVRQTFRPGEELNVYFEIYNLKLNPETNVNNFSVEYFFFHGGKLLSQVSSPPGEQTSDKDCTIQTSFRIKNFKLGVYTLRVKVVDSNSGGSAIKEIRFVVSH